MRVFLILFLAFLGASVWQDARADAITLYEGYYRLQPKTEVLASGAAVQDGKVSRTLENPARRLFFHFSDDDTLVAVSVVREQQGFGINKALGTFPAPDEDFVQLMMLSLVNDQLGLDIWAATRKRDRLALIQSMHITNSGDVFLWLAKRADIDAAFPQQPGTAEEVGKGLPDNARVAFIIATKGKVILTYTLHGDMGEAIQAARGL
jgi:hypothetical protein